MSLLSYVARLGCSYILLNIILYKTKFVFIRAFFLHTSDSRQKTRHKKKATRLDSFLIKEYFVFYTSVLTVIPDRLINSDIPRVNITVFVDLNFKKYLISSCALVNSLRVSSLCSLTILACSFVTG